MKRRMMLLTMALAMCAAAVSAGDGDPAEMMKKMTTPGEHHEHMAMMAGEYTYVGKSWMPGGDPVEWTGTRSAKMILGGRYLEENVTGTFMGNFVGRGLLAYDTMADQYEYTWVDNMGTGILRAHGSCSEDGWVLSGEHFNPMVGARTSFKTVLKPTDTGFVFEWYEGMPDGTEKRTMEITYTKKG